MFAHLIVRSNAGYNLFVRVHAPGRGSALNRVITGAALPPHPRVCPIVFVVAKVNARLTVRGDNERCLCLVLGPFWTSARVGFSVFRTIDHHATKIKQRNRYNIH